MYDFDVIIIGGGSAGFAAAGRAVEQGAKTAMVEAGALGGACPNWACVPTKTFLAAAEMLAAFERADHFGIKADNVSLDFAKLVEQKDAVVRRLTGERLRQVLDQRGISLFTDRAHFISDHEIELDGKRLAADKFIVATGSRPLVPEIQGLEEVGYITSNEAVDLKELPKSIVIIGGGAVAVEFAQIFNQFGVITSLVHAGPRLLEDEDAEIAGLLEGYLKEAGIQVVTGADVKAVVWRTGVKEVEIETPAAKRIIETRRIIEAEQVMVAAGRRPAVDGLSLEAARVAVGVGGISVNRHLATSAPNIWACGDVTGKPFYTHLATYQGDLAGFNAVAASPDAADYRLVPRVVFCLPEAAAVGLTETQAIMRFGDVRVGRMALRYLGRSLIMGERRGLVKLVAVGERIVGAHIIGPSAGELIHEIAAAMKGSLTIEALAGLIHAYPTMAEGIGVAAAGMVQAEGPSIEEAA
jgi:mercuric reductase